MRLLPALLAIVVIFFSGVVYAEDPPQEVVKTEMEESVVINDYIGGYSKFYYDGNQLKNASPVLNTAQSADWYALHPRQHGSRNE